MNRSSAVLLPITSLASPYGIGSLGGAALRFVDFLADAKVRYWQMLPVNPVGAGNSPYFTSGVFAGEPLLIDLDELAADNLLKHDECTAYDWGSDETTVDYAKVKAGRDKLLRLAYSRASQRLIQSVGEFAAFRPEIMQYARYMALCKTLDTTFPPQTDEFLKGMTLKDSGLSAQIQEEERYQKFLQYLFFWQFGRLRAYAAGRGVKFIGDLPIYVSPESADLWANAQLFQTDEKGRPTRVAGVPPDAFSNDGQLWGNPLYDWDVMRADNFAWWKKRMHAAAELYDMVRLDHFRAFDQYWSVEINSKTALNGSWQPGPGMALFDEIKKELGDYPVIAEDLGTITDSVRALRRQTGYLGMRVLQFGFVDESDNEHLPHHHTGDLAVYTGTHDNDILQNFVRQMSPALRARCRDYFGVDNGSETDALLRAAFSSVAQLCVIPMQDLPGVSNPRRMNTPATVSQSNWSWRLNQSDINPEKTQVLNHFNTIYGRT